MSLSKSLMDYEGAMSMASEHPCLVTAILASSLAVVYCVKSVLSSPRLPPGPPAWPVAGSLFSLTENMHLDIVRLRQQYGDVFTLWMGGKPLIVLASYAAIKEAFLTRGNEFAGRPTKVFMLHQETYKDEIFMATFSEKWSRDKKFALKCVRTVGVMNGKAEGSIVEELAVFLNKLRDLSQTPVDISEVTLNMTASIMSGVLFNERMDHDDPKLRELRDLVTNFNDSMNDFSFIETMLPTFLVNLLRGDKDKKFNKATKELEDYIAQRVAEHHETFDAANPRDLLDLYLDKPDVSIGKSFFHTIIGFTSDSIDTMSVFMRWIILYLGHHPEIQKKVQAEIDEEVGPSQMVTIAERGLLKYTEAVFLEVLRCSDCALQTEFHAPVSNGATIRGYDIPQYCTIAGSLYGVHKDPELFPEPEKFDPLRFLDDHGDVIKSNMVIPFGIGRRMCLGESLAKLELFLFLANVLHVFSIEFPADEPKPSLEPAGGLIQFPHPYKAIFVPRE